MTPPPFKIPKKRSPQQTTPYFTVFMTNAMVALSVFILMAALRPSQDNTVLSLAVSAVVATVVVGIGLIIKVIQDATHTVDRNFQAISDLRGEVDGRLTQLLTLTASASKAEGVKQEKEATHPIVIDTPPLSPTAAKVSVENVETLLVTDAKI